MHYLIPHKDFKIGIKIPILKNWKLRLRETKMSFSFNKRYINSYVNNL